MTLKHYVLAVLLAFFFYSRDAKCETSDDKIFVNYLTTGATTGQDSGISKVEAVQISLGLPPLEFGPVKENKLIPTLGYKSQNLQLNSGKEGRLNKASAGLIYVYQFKRGYGLSLIAGEIWRSEDGNAFNWSEQVSPYGVLLFTVPMGSEWKLFLGASYSNDFGSHLILPAVGIEYRSIDKSDFFEFSFPRLNYFHRVSKELQLGFSADADMGVFRTAAANSKLASNSRTAYISPFEVYVGPALRYGLGVPTFNLSSGFALIRQTTEYDKDFNQISQSGMGGVSWFANAGVSLQFGG